MRKAYKGTDTTGWLIKWRKNHNREGMNINIDAGYHKLIGFITLEVFSFP